MTLADLPVHTTAVSGPLPATRAVGILGGMGPAAGADFVRLFVQACSDLLRRRGQPVSDQAFPTHWLAQLPVPDRTQALVRAGAGDDAPLAAMAAALGQLESLGVDAVAIACNTAHAWHGALQGRYPRLELLHVAREVADHLRAAGAGEAGLLATEGTYSTGLYQDALARLGIRCHVPDQAGRDRLMRGIYDGVKIGDLARARGCFVQVAQQLLARHGDIPLIMGCTEIPLALEGAPQAGRWTLVNAGRVLAEALALRAYAA